MRIIIVDVFVYVIEQSNFFLKLIIGLFIIGFSMIMFRCLHKPQPIPDNNSGFDFVKEGASAFETNSNNKVTAETGSAGTTVTRNQNIVSVNDTEQSPDEPHNLYYCTIHETYFSYNEQVNHYECKNAIKIVNIKFCWGCQQHYGATERMIHFGHGRDVPYDSDKPNYRKFYCDTCGFYHYENKWIKGIGDGTAIETVPAVILTNNWFNGVECYQETQGTRFVNHNNYNVSVEVRYSTEYVTDFRLRFGLTPNGGERTVNASIGQIRIESVEKRY